MFAPINNIILRHPKIRLVAIVLAVLVVIALAGSARLGFIKSFGIVFGSILLLFLPGFFVTLIFFPGSDTLLNKEKSENDNRTLDIIERTTLAGLLSIVITSVAVFGLHGIFENSKLSPRNLALAIVFLNMVIGAISFWKQKWLTLAQSLVIAVFPFVVIGLSIFGGVALTKHNIMLEFFVFTGIIVAIFSVSGRFRKRFAR